MADLLATIQQKLKAPKSQFNDFGKYKYRNCEDILEALKPLLGDTALMITDDVVMVGNRCYVKATASLVKEGATIASTTAFAREPESKKGMDESQVTGAASSYARKYALNGLFAIDDARDADATNKPETHKEAKPVEKKLQEQSSEPGSLFGIVEKVEKKVGVTKGKAWTRYGIFVDGKVYGTFDTKIGDKATDLEGQRVKVSYKQDGKYMTCTDLESAPEDEDRTPY